MGPKRRNQFASKHVRLTAQQSFPEPVDDQFIVRLLRSRGGNTMECEDSAGAMLLCWLPNKFSKVVWAQRGDYLIVAPSAEEEGASKVSATIVHILFPEQVQHLRPLGCWPEGFTEPPTQEKQQGDGNDADGMEEKQYCGGSTERGLAEGEEGGAGSEESDNDDDLFVNNNHTREDSYEDESNESDDE